MTDAQRVYYFFYDGVPYNNIKLYYHLDAIAFLEIENIKSNFKMYIKHLRADFIIRSQLVEQNKLSKSRMFLVYLIKLFSYLLK